MIRSYEDKDIYDGWILSFNDETGEIWWRDHWAVEKLSEEKKKDTERFIRKTLLK